MKKRIGIIVYSNPDYLPPIINATRILAKEFNLVVICRNQEQPQIAYPNNVRLYRLGKLKTAREKETQSLVIKFLEYITFVVRTIFYIQFYNCRFIYSYNMHGFVSGFLASRFGKKKPLIYHNFDLCELEKTDGLTYIIEYLELVMARYADRVIFPDINRARYFQTKAKLTKLPDIVMNTPLRIDRLPSNNLEEILKAKGFNLDTKVVLYQGAINEAHSISEVIQSMTFWPKDTVFVLSGIIRDDFKKAMLAKTKVLNLVDRIIYLSYLPYSQIFYYAIGAYVGLALYKPMDINQLFNAGASNKIFEYISLGIPVITNDSPYFREVLDSSFAYFAKHDSVEDIARAINLAFSDVEEYRRKSQAARQAHLTRFNYEVQFNPIIEYIKKVTL
jgi:glycosyltransferase involved in cell wall biosynthesis